MSDLIERLRNAQDAINSPGEDAALHFEAVDEIESQRAVIEAAKIMADEAQTEIERLRAALRYISSGRRHPTCPTCSDSREVAIAALENDDE